MEYFVNSQGKEKLLSGTQSTLCLLYCTTIIIVVDTILSPAAICLVSLPENVINWLTDQVSSNPPRECIEYDSLLRIVSMLSY